VLPTKKRSYSSFIFDIFSNISVTTVNKKKPNPPKILLMHGYLSKLKLDNFLFCFKRKNKTQTKFLLHHSSLTFSRPLKFAFGIRPSVEKVVWGSRRRKRQPSES